MRARLACIALAFLGLAIEAVAEERTAEGEGGEAPRWFQVEIVVFRQPLSSSLQENLLHPDPLPLPFDMIALLPPEEEQVRPWLLTQFESGWMTPAFEPRVRVLKTGLSPELEDLIDYVEALNLRVRNDATFALLRTLSESPVERLLPSAETSPAPPPTPEPIDVPAPPQALMSQKELQAALAVVPEVPIEAAFKALPPAKQQLRKEAAALARRAGYRIIAHEAWLERIEKDVTQAPVMIATDLQDRSEQGEILGTVRLRLSRYVHAEISLSFPYGPGGGYAHLVETRRITQPLQYIDHPLFGALLRIDSYPLPAPEVE